jgi:hypothetical protein
MSWGELLIEAARNNSCVITIVDYHGNPIYRVVASMPVWVTCRRFPWKAPTIHSREDTPSKFWMLQGFFLVPGPPHPTVRCDDRTATWQIWLPAAELTLLTHYSASSVPSRVLAVMETILQQLRGRTSRQVLGGFGLPVTKGQVRQSDWLLIHWRRPAQWF